MESSGRQHRPLQIAPGRILLGAKPILGKRSFGDLCGHGGIGMRAIDAPQERQQFIQIALRHAIQFAGNEFALPHTAYIVRQALA